jgi:hypothetical protein
MRWGDWDVVEGAFFDCWRHEKHVVRPIHLPEHWLRFRSGDWGSAKPFSIGWWAVATDDFRHPDGHIFPRGAMIRYREWYGIKEDQFGNKIANTGLKLFAEPVAQGILERERSDEKIDYSVLDPSAFAEDGGPSIAERMARINNGKGIWWRRADNRRVPKDGAIGGWDQMRARLIGEDGVPMIYCFDTCADSIRTIPVIQHDDKRPEDLDTNSEDHAADDWRYACMSRPYTAPKPEKPKDPLDAFKTPPTMNELLEQVSRTNNRERRI